MRAGRRIKTFLQRPAIQAGLLQAAAFPLTLLCVYLLAKSGLKINYLILALIQGAIAASLTVWRGLAAWWRLIQFTFPVLLVLAQGVDLPPSLFLLAFLLFLFLYWSTYRTQVPYYPSNQGVWDAVAERLPAGHLKVIDIGSGLGGFVLDLAKRRPEIEVVGIELAPLPWLISRLRGKHFLLGDYEFLDFGHYDAVFAYLSPAAMPALYAKARREMRPGTQLFSFEFDIPEHPPTDRIIISGQKSLLHIWNF